jgi:hypothetical protein
MDALDIESPIYGSYPLPLSSFEDWDHDYDDDSMVLNAVTVSGRFGGECDLPFTKIN